MYRAGKLSHLTSVFILFMSTVFYDELLNTYLSSHSVDIVHFVMF